MEKFQNKYRIPSARLQNWDYGNDGAYFITICVDKMQCVFGDVVSNSNVSNADVETRLIASKIAVNKNAEMDNVETRLIASVHDAIDKKSEMRLNELGKIAHEIWQEIPNKFPFVELGNFVVMPNHMHGILIINKIVETRFIASKNANENWDANANANANGNANGNANENANENAIANENANVETRLIASVSPRISPPPDDNKNGGISGNNNPMFHENISRIVRWYKGRCSFEMRKIHADFNWQTRFYDHVIRDSRAFDTIQNYIEENPSKWKNDKFRK